MYRTYLGLNDTSKLVKQAKITCVRNDPPLLAEVDWPQVLEEQVLPGTGYWPEPAVRLHILITNPPDLNGTLRLAHTSIPVPSDVLSRVAFSLEDYEALWQNDAGSTSILEEPRRFLMQTPNDGGTFCSLVTQTNRPPKSQEESYSDEDIGRNHSPYNTILIASESDLSFSRILQPVPVPPEWDTTDLPLVILPLDFLIIHVRQVSNTLAELTSEVSSIEDIVINDNDKTDFKSLIKRLHVCSRELVKLRRRWHFQVRLAETIRELIEIHDPIVAATRREAQGTLAIHGDIAIENNAQMTIERGTVYGDISVRDMGAFHSDQPQKMERDPLTQSREYRQLLSSASLQLKLSQSLEYDLNVLPERISNQFNAIFNLMAQRDTQASMSVAESSRKDNLYMQDIADATLRDSSSMKTIAVLTMVFLPGTFICSFFSMTMFNWNNQPHEPLVSPYIWVYFTAMVPLTLLVLAVWWWKTRESRREQEENKKKRTIARGNTWRGSP